MKNKRKIMRMTIRRSIGIRLSGDRKRNISKKRRKSRSLSRI
jgi:hypothetical protein